MKITKWFLLAMLALLCCACSKNNPLAYVDEDADMVIYGNLEQVLEHKFWKKFEKTFKKTSEFKEFTKGLKDKLGVSLDECGAKFALWGNIKEGEEPENLTCVIVFDEILADDVIDALKEDFEEKGEVDETTVDDCETYVFYRTWTAYDGKTKKRIEYSIAKIDKHIIQVFIESEPETIAKPKNKSALAKQLDKDCIAGIAISGDAICDGLEKELGIEDIPEIGDVVMMIYADNSEIKLEATVDISDMD